jgi:hypothetical protein
MSKPSTLGLRGSRTKFDDFQAAHVLQAEIAHFVVGYALESMALVGGVNTACAPFRGSFFPSTASSSGHTSKLSRPSAGIPGLNRETNPSSRLRDRCTDLVPGTGRRSLMLAPSPSPSCWTPSWVSAATGRDKIAVSMTDPLQTTSTLWGRGIRSTTTVSSAKLATLRARWQRPVWSIGA